MAKARKQHGLGEILSDGYELTDHVVVDDDHTFNGTMKSSRSSSLDSRLSRMEFSSTS